MNVNEAILIYLWKIDCDIKTFWQKRCGAKITRSFFSEIRILI